jgi:hypothetical protein
MTDPGTDLTTEFAKELAKQFPIKEAFSAPAEQTGQILQDIVKTIQLALVPFQVAGALQDRLRGFIDRSVRAVPEKNRVSPPPQLLGPIIESIRYEPEGTALDEMFSKLLSAASPPKTMILPSSISMRPTLKPAFTAPLMAFVTSPCLKDCAPRDISLSLLSAAVRIHPTKALGGFFGGKQKC